MVLKVLVCICAQELWTAATFHGGEQEKGLRAGTEALHQIAGMAKELCQYPMII
jgi:cysteine sulfinate desulfinase/cysteine desulfurase-like protein